MPQLRVGRGSWGIVGAAGILVVASGDFFHSLLQKIDEQRTLVGKWM
jgi:hypothetical protein